MTGTPLLLRQGLILPVVNFQLTKGWQIEGPLPEEHGPESWIVKVLVGP